jgi:cytochrome c556
MPNSRRVTALSLLLAAAALPPGLAADPVEDAVDFRQGVMNVFSWNLTRMGSMVKGETPFDAAAFKGYATDLAAASGMDVMQGFPDDSVSDESDAKDEIWLNRDDFDAKYKALKEAAAKLSQVAAGGDEGAMREQFKETAGACKACHKEYKK